MIKIVGVRFRNAGKIYYFGPGNLDLTAGMHVIVETARGIEMGTVMIPARDVIHKQRAARILLPAARTTLEHLNRRIVRFFVAFAVLSLLLCRLICIVLIPRCEPALIMHPRYQEHLAQ